MVTQEKLSKLQEIFDKLTETSKLLRYEENSIHKPRMHYFIVPEDLSIIVRGYDYPKFSMVISIEPNVPVAYNTDLEYISEEKSDWRRETALDILRIFVKVLSEFNSLLEDI